METKIKAILGKYHFMVLCSYTPRNRKPLKKRYLRPRHLYLSYGSSHTSTLTTILVKTPKHRDIVVVIHSCLIVALAGTPVFAHAGVFSSISDRIKALVVQDNSSSTNEESLTAQTMPVLKPVLLEEGDLKPISYDASTSDTLSVTTGSMRLSTEDIVFPVNDTISVYEVKKGDTLASIAKLFNISKNTILWANDIKNNTVSAGDTLVILPVSGIKHTVKKGDTIASIAKKYKADSDDISKYNGISRDTELTIGDVVLVPEGELSVAVTPSVIAKVKKITQKLATAPLGFFVRPLVGGIKTQGIHGHNAVDIAAKIGTPIVATASGRVIVAKMGGYNGGYGNMIVIAHENNIQTLYAHLSQLYITPGQTVTQGQVIGAVGTTGRSTGPHLHIEVRGAVNPF